MRMTTCRPKARGGRPRALGAVPSRALVIAASLSLLLAPAAAQAFAWAPSAPGPAGGGVVGKDLLLANGAVSAAWSVDGGLKFRAVGNGWTSATASGGEAFALVFRDGAAILASKLKPVGEPRFVDVKAAPGAARAGDRAAGHAIELDLKDEATGLSAAWRAVLRDDAHYVRQEIRLTAGKGDIPPCEALLVDLHAPGISVRGATPGSPLASDAFFAGFEHPMSQTAADGARGGAKLVRRLPLRAGTAVSYSSVVGVAPPGQLRRAFHAYVERERARPYRPFLHYNSWYDLGYFTKYHEAECVEVVKTYAERLVKRRGVAVDSFLFDDGWDEPSTSWEFHAGFPNGFLPLKEAAAAAGAGPGVWLSPWGGYGKPREERLKSGARAGYATDAPGFALSGTKYSARFRAVCLDLLSKYGINHFKLDGTGSPDKQCPGSAFDSDFEAAISLIADLRAAKPDLFVNLTTGTWPSPFWLRHADSIWRGGEDHEFLGVGSRRRRWTTYRDADTYAGIVKKGPLFPLNSLMVHGVIYAKHAHGLNDDPEGDFRDEVRSYFASGTQLQELYVTPSLLSEANWDDLAAAARWARERADVLRDVRWIGGDPAQLEVYGWAAWSPKRATLALRNPKDKPQAFFVDLASVFEPPPGAAKSWTFAPAFGGADAPRLVIAAGSPKVVDLAPFETTVLDGVPTL